MMNQRKREHAEMMLKLGDVALIMEKAAYSSYKKHDPIILVITVMALRLSLSCFLQKRNYSATGYIVLLMLFL